MVARHGREAMTMRCGLRLHIHGIVIDGGFSRAISIRCATFRLGGGAVTSCGVPQTLEISSAIYQSGLQNCLRPQLWARVSPRVGLSLPPGPPEHPHNVRLLQENQVQRRSRDGPGREPNDQVTTSDGEASQRRLRAAKQAEAAPVQTQPKTKKENVTKRRVHSGSLVVVSTHKACRKRECFGGGQKAQGKQRGCPLGSASTATEVWAIAHLAVGPADVVEHDVHSPAPRESLKRSSPVTAPATSPPFPRR